jgi:hypothetical protein
MRFFIFFFQTILQLLPEISLSVLFIGAPDVAYRQAYKTQRVVKISPGAFWYTFLPVAAINQFVLK